MAMVESLSPSRFYGSSLPRPRFLSDGGGRVDPPPPVLDPLLAWATDAHWSMGGLSFDRKRLVGKIDGRVERIRAHEEQLGKKAASKEKRKYALIDESEEGEEEEDVCASHLPARVTRKQAAMASGGVGKEASTASGKTRKRRLVKKADVGGLAGEPVPSEISTPSPPRRSPRTKKI